MRTSFNVDDMTIHRIVEQEQGFTPALEFLPGLSRELLEENRSWLEPAALDPETDKLVLCFQSYVVKTPRHTVLIDSCIGNDKIRPTREAWNKKTDDYYMRALKAAGVSVYDRLRDVHASPRRPRRVEYAPRKRPLGPDLSQCPLSVFA
jgi:hypothetical protein